MLRTGYKKGNTEPVSLFE